MRDLAGGAVDHGDRTAHAGRGDERAIARHGKRDDRRLAGVDRRAQHAGADSTYTLPSAPAVRISPSGATATALSDVGNVATIGAPPPWSGQMRSVAS